jgi:hypothetical protein
MAPAGSVPQVNIAPARHGFVNRLFDIDRGRVDRPERSVDTLVVSLVLLFILVGLLVVRGVGASVRKAERSEHLIRRKV